MNRQSITEHVLIDGAGCWLWLGAISTNGYGRLGDGYAHRASYEIFRGPIPEGMHIDHLCRVRHCANPEHLEVVTQAENTRRGMAPNIIANREGTCTLGHPMVATKTGRRYCRTCLRERMRKAYRERRYPSIVRKAAAL